MATENKGAPGSVSATADFCSLVPPVPGRICDTRLQIFVAYGTSLHRWDSDLFEVGGEAMSHMRHSTAISALGSDCRFLSHMGHRTGSGSSRPVRKRKRSKHEITAAGGAAKRRGRDSIWINRASSAGRGYAPNRLGVCPASGELPMKLHPWRKPNRTAAAGHPTPSYSG